MKITEISELESSFLERIAKEGIKELNPVQKAALDAGVLNGKNLIVSAPTASGKTLIATLAIAKALYENKKAIYCAPLKALAREKYLSYRKIFKEFKVAISTGDYDSSGKALEDKNLVVCTFEKLDSLLRHDATWIYNCGVIVFDEVHVLDDVERGPTLEFVLTILKEASNAQLIGLSATVENSDEIAEWLGCGLVKSSYRPVKLYEGVCLNNRIRFYNNSSQAEDREIENIYGDTLFNILDDTLKSGKQAIVFVMSRKRAEKLALNYAKSLKIRAYKQNKKIAARVKNVLEIPTEQCIKLSKCCSRKIAFHHAGLLNQQREIIEKAFREGSIKVIFATPTLAMGVSLPSFRVIISEFVRYGNSGVSYIPVMEYKQLVGRAGRPEHHEYGEAISIAKSKKEADFIARKYIFGKNEKIYSKLAVERILRTFVLNLINSGLAKTVGELQNFFSKTFYAKQYRDVEYVKSKVLELLVELEEWGMIDENLVITLLGKRVCELYLDPLTAISFLNFLDNVESFEEFYIFLLICSAKEIEPLLPLSKSELEYIEENFGIDVEKISEKFSEKFYGTKDFGGAIKLSAVLKLWIEECPEKLIFETFKIYPGELRSKLEMAEWLLYCLAELCRIKGFKYREIEKLRTRVKYGVKEELIDLVRIKGIGRVRARILYNAGIRRVEDLKNFERKKLKALLGEKLAERLAHYNKNVKEKNLLSYFR